MNVLRTHRAALPAFTPTAVPAEELAARTVGRDEIVRRLARRLRSAARSKERPHFLVVGPRGSGKTHLLRVVVHETLQDRRTARRLAAVVLPEDAPEIVFYNDLLFSIVERLLGQGPRPQNGTLLADARAARRDTLQLEQVVLRALGDRTLLLVVENLNRVFHDFGDDGQARLRAFAENTGRLMLLASTPLLFDGVSEHARPWYGAFSTEMLDDLSAEEGGALLRHLAAVAGDDELAAFLETPTARARLRAVTHVTGGSPRMWTVLAACVTVETLDELAPLVRTLLDELVPYYQERLNSLPGNERKLVVELCRSAMVERDGAVVQVSPGMRTVKELAELSGLDATIAATSLRRLHDARWVRRTKLPGTDQRTTWYEIREPMLRHHLQYRDSDGELLNVIVSFLRDWYSIAEQRERLALADPGSIDEDYFRGAMRWSVATTIDSLFGDTDPIALLAGARGWLERRPSDPERAGMSRLAAIAAEAAALAVLSGEEAAREALALRTVGSDPADREVAEAVATAAIEAATTTEAEAEPEKRVQRALDAAVEAVDPLRARDSLVLRLLATGWAITRVDVPEIHPRLDTLRDDAEDAGDPLLVCAVDSMRSLALLREENYEQARDVARACLDERLRLLGSAHPDTAEIAYRLAVAFHGANPENPDLPADLLPAFESAIEFADERQRPFLMAVATGAAIQAAEWERAGHWAEVQLELPDDTAAMPRYELAVTAGFSRDLREEWSAAVRFLASAVREESLYSGYLIGAGEEVRAGFADAAKRVSPMQLLDGDAELRAALELALETDADRVLAGWLGVLAEQPPVGKAASIATRIAEILVRDDADKDVVVALMAVASERDEAHAHLIDWIAWWEATLAEQAEASYLLAIVRALRLALLGGRSAMAELPAELRDVVLAVVDGKLDDIVRGS
ncbi:hypothetical protein Cwoe_4861 [Conexibacter woesei DSM 14684]|uniref:Orc1-like AAA ATPase domain-containing protein n=2 Tax=Conexibacter TaxID=191494 RepID=D3FB81_CONWI|nr:hypothetical protein Cwoe_4861 [Conexibacter woesei DSM 14684]